MKVNQGTYVQIERLLLTPEERPSTLPIETKDKPYLVYINGFLENDTASIGDKIKITTRIGRPVEGKLFKINPEYDHSFGPQVVALMNISTN